MKIPIVFASMLLSLGHSYGQQVGFESIGHATKIQGQILVHAEKEKIRLIDRVRHYMPLEETNFEEAEHSANHFQEPGHDPLLKEGKWQIEDSAITSIEQWEGIYSGYYRSDNNLAVGPNHVVQVINSSYYSSLIRVWGKDGSILLDKSLFKDLTGDYDWGDPNIIYDWEADRFIISFLYSEEDNRLIIAASETSDPTGPWYGYVFLTPGGYPDYEKLGRWGDDYVITVAAGKPAVYVLNRSQILNGEAEVDVVTFKPSRIPNQGWQALSPVHQATYSAVPGDGPSIAIRVVEGSFYDSVVIADHIEIFNLYANWDNLLESYMEGPINIPVSPFIHSVCDTVMPNACLEQPGTDVKIWPCMNFLMDKPQMVVIDGSIHLVCTHLINADASDTVAGMRWYELRKPMDSNWEMVQEGSFSPDNVHRFMGSISINSEGSIALGYNVVNQVTFPGMRATGRRNCDPPGMMLEEISLKEGTASNASNSYGDYNSMVSDPTDGSFWFTAQYNQTGKWSTHVAHLSIPSCLTDVQHDMEEPFPSVYPNPVQDAIQITGINSYHTSYQLIDEIGRVVLSGNTAIPGIIEVSGLSAGIYLLTLESEGQQFSIPIMKE